MNLPDLILVDAPAIHLNIPPWEWVSTIPDYYNLWYGIEGIGSLAIDGRQHSVVPGKAFLIPPGSSVRGYRKPGYQIKNFTAHFRFKTPNGCHQPLDDNPFAELAPPNRRAMEQRMQEICSRSRSRDELSMRESAALCFVILADFIRLHETKRHPHGDTRLENLLNVIDSQPGSYSKVEELCDASGLSQAHLRRLFHERTGLSPIAYLTRQKIERACDLLRSSSISIADIASTLGYEDPFYFSRLFKKHKSASPAQWRAAKSAS